MDRNALNRRFNIVSGRDSAVDGLLCEYTVLQLLLKCIDRQPINIAAIDQFFEQQVNVELVIVLFPSIFAIVPPGFQRFIDISNHLKDRLGSQFSDNILPLAVMSLHI